MTAQGPLTGIVLPINVPSKSVDDTEYHWLHNRYQEMLMHEDELLNDRISFMLTASSIFLGAYFVAASISPWRPISMATAFILAGVGLFLCWDWHRVVNRTTRALELWRGILLRIERPKLDTVDDVSRLHAIYWQHELEFGENAGYRSEEGDERTIGEKPPADSQLGLKPPTETVATSNAESPKTAGAPPLRVQLIMPYVFAVAWSLIVVVSVIQMIVFYL